MKHILTALLLAGISTISFAHGHGGHVGHGGNSSAKAGANAYIISPSHGQAVTSPVHVKFGLMNMGVAPAGVEVEGTGHHHLLINMDELPAMDKPLPATEHIVHFGGGQTETVVELPKGEHTLQLLLGDHLHIPHATPVLSEKITIHVK